MTDPAIDSSMDNVALALTRTDTLMSYDERRFSGPKTKGFLALRQRHGCDIELFLQMLGEHFKVESTPLVATGSNGMEAASQDVSRVKHPPRLYMIQKKL